MKAISYLFVFFFLSLPVAVASSDISFPEGVRGLSSKIATDKDSTNEGDCTCKGIPLYGKVKVVEDFADFKVEIVSSFPDLKVKKVSSFPDDCGEWEFVDSFPDFTIQYVESFPDFTIQFVESFPGR